MNLSDDKKSFWTEWLKEKQIDKKFGYSVSTSLRKRLDEEIFKAQEEKESALQLVENVKDAIELLKQNGITITDGKWNKHNARSVIQNITNALPEYFLTTLSRVKIEIEVIEKELIKEE